MSTNIDQIGTRPVPFEQPLSNGMLYTCIVPCCEAALEAERQAQEEKFRELKMELDALSVIIADLTWCGGLTEGRKIAAMADAWHVPVAFHDCTGPVALAASTHLALHARNCFIQEMVRAFYYGWYGELVTALPPVENGRITVPDAPGLGLELLPDITKRPDCSIRRSVL